MPRPAEQHATKRRIFSEGKLAALASLVFLLVLPSFSSNLTIYRTGLVLIFIVACVGLHILVNWAGELSLTHAGLVGIPAFLVASISTHSDVSVILLIPAGVLIGAAVGSVIALPVLRAKGLQVALVTLAVSLAISNYFFNQPWLAGPPAGASVKTPTLGPMRFATSRSLYVILLILFILSILVAWALYRSKIARAFYWVKANPDAAAVFGIPVKMYRVLAFTLSGAFAGLAGSLMIMWVQQVDASAFPTTLSYSYLTVVVVAGNGFIGGVAVVSLVLEGGLLFFSWSGALISYLGPIGLIFTLARHSDGINGQGRHLLHLVFRWRRTHGAGTARLNDGVLSSPASAPESAVASTPSTSSPGPGGAK